MWSAFDGSDNQERLVQIAKELGHTALGMSEHGVVNGLVKHYYACKEAGIKPVMGCEIYFKPKVDNDKPYYHLCLFAKNKQGYHNLNQICTIASTQTYYKPIVTFKELENYREGLICTSACVASFLAKSILNDRLDIAEKYLVKMVGLFGDDFYIEVQPYTVSEVGMQEKVNIESIKLAKKLHIKCILTSDSHYGKKEDFDTYLKMHEISGHDINMIRNTYSERYMPSDNEMKQRFIKMHKNDFSNIERLGTWMINNLKEIEDKVDNDILDQLTTSLPDFSEGKEKSSFEYLVEYVKNGLKKRGKYTKEYINRAKEELDVIKTLHFEDYFLMVQDYVNWAKSNGITVGPGRGSGCNSLVNYALGITDVDSIKFGLDFRRFLRKDKVKMPDIDIDFETARREEVMEYLTTKYKGKACQICSYGLYKVDNLINDLTKVCGLPTDVKVDEDIRKNNKIEIANIKSYINQYVTENELDLIGLKKDKKYMLYNGLYNNIIKHFTLLYQKVRFIGTHAAGVAITGGDLLDYTAIKEDKKTGKLYSSYDLADLEKIHIIKFDILGLSTMEELGQLRRLTHIEGIGKNEQWTEDENILKAFKNGNTDGIFQFEKSAAKNMLNDIDCDSFGDIVATNAMNRPGPLSLKMHKIYAQNKQNINNAKNECYYQYTKDSYGTVIYQEQIMQLCVNIGNMDWGQADKIIKMDPNGTAKGGTHSQFVQDFEKYKKIFLNGAKNNGVNLVEAENLYNNFFNYSFNKGHAVGYSLISIEEMFFKLNYPLEFWENKLKVTYDDLKIEKYKSEAVKSGCVIMLPHVNGPANFKIVEYGGGKVIQCGLSSIKGIGEKAAQIIFENSPYIDFPDFEDKIKESGNSRAITSKVISILKEQGCLEFNDKLWYRRNLLYNRSLVNKNFI
jgi:DNA polymerase-3 subunit alpha